MVEDAVVETDLEVEHGSREIARMNSPSKPSHNEIDLHSLTNLPFRSWCPTCIKGRGKEMPHCQTTADAGMPEVHFDFFVMGDDGDPGRTVAALCARSRHCKMTMSAAVPSKSTGTYIARRTIAFLREMGVEHRDVVAKSDSEPAVVSILNEVDKIRAGSGVGSFVHERSVTGDSRSNGIVERAAQSFEDMVRVLKTALEARWNVKVPPNHPVAPWLIEYAAFLLDRFEVGADGKTACERCKGKRAKVLGVEFGEAVLWKRRPTRGALGKLTSLWGDGLYSGVKGSSGEIIVGDAKGVWKCRT